MQTEINYEGEERGKRERKSKGKGRGGGRGEKEMRRGKHAETPVQLYPQPLNLGCVTVCKCNHGN